MGIEYHKIKLHSPEWFNFRMNNGCGASEIGVIMGLSPYKSSIKLFYEKLGIIKPKERTVRMHIGNMSEGIIADLFDYWENDNDTFLKNLNDGRKVRKLEELGSYCLNSEMKNIFASLDRHYRDTGFPDSDGQYIAVELKNTTQMAFSQYKDGVNPSNLVQLATQILCSGYKEGYLATLIDNVRFEVLKLTYKEALSMKSAIVNSVNEFWNGVLRAREYQTMIFEARKSYNMKAVAELEMLMLQCEPKIDNDLAYLDFLTEQSKIRKESIAIKGNDELLKKAQDLKKLETKRKKIIEQETQLKADLARVMREEGKQSIDFGKLGSIQMFGRFTNKIK